jgi:hypothetical protein
MRLLMTIFSENFILMGLPVPDRIVNKFFFYSCCSKCTILRRSTPGPFSQTGKISLYYFIFGEILPHLQGVVPPQ